ncbi:Flp pilus assembly protein CpaB [Paenibacillus sp. OK060]|uniref:SAF domain-containing protein n=1 Tax=Paenibacillus sp. OK060 TaxID=1881034 RepID=UPI00088665C2|nr:SAF domain-containing protein [Paenibacillus sp. OK060]SDM14667.1 Flp pilus assembly protein CpaB [Paenibacillus sp. OK060]
MSKVRQRTKNLIIAGIVGALSMGVLSTGGAIYLIKQQAKDQKALRTHYESQLVEAEALLQHQQSTMKTVVVASKALKEGDKLKKENLKVIQIPETDAPTNMVQSPDDLYGKIVKIDVGENTPMINSMVFDNGPTPRDLRIQEYNVMLLPTKLKKGQFVDVRLTFPTGEDFIVLSKKKVEDLSGTTVWYKMNEAELLVMTSAIVDAYLNGAKLYAVTYADPYMQEKAIPNYPANLKVIDLIQSDPNVLTYAKEQLKRAARQVLENNLSQMDEADKMKIQNGSLILQQEVANNQLTSQQNNEAVTGTQTTPAPDTNTAPSTLTDNSVDQNPTSQTTEASKESIVQPIAPETDNSTSEEKQKDVFGQPLVK